MATTQMGARTFPALWSAAQDQIVILMSRAGATCADTAKAIRAAGIHRLPGAINSRCGRLSVTARARRGSLWSDAHQAAAVAALTARLCPDHLAAALAAVDLGLTAPPPPPPIVPPLVIDPRIAHLHLVARVITRVCPSHPARVVAGALQ